MQPRSSASKLVVLGTFIAAGLPLGSQAAHAAREHGHAHTSHKADHGAHRAARHHHATGHLAAVSHHGRHGHHGNAAHGHRVASRGISCVPFARAESGIEISGNAKNWWHNAAGVYARGVRPEVGSVLNFRSNDHMRLGHVAVVTDVIDSRHVEIDHSNWSRHGTVSRNVSVVDVSPDNDWSEVRVQLARGETYGSVYPTFGFIYARAAGSMTVAQAGQTMRPHVQQAMAVRPVRGDEVAELPAVRHGLDLSLPGLANDAPSRSLR